MEKSIEMDGFGVKKQYLSACSRKFPCWCGCVGSAQGDASNSQQQTDRTGVWVTDSRWSAKPIMSMSW